MMSFWGCESRADEESWKALTEGYGAESYAKE